ncbi:LysR substrate-binding domain-containing protein [Polaromonas sp. JS666]|uniref:LysR substrate-binding domain-containing protein n=1 Tax=Polaromonas sp. (strain JS666 / ATCC BAA-500) TaxID=296591 RepID=UPI000887D9D4|nr:LysR substrate-binding domain-containing protein [Polaromonas sp. JS666]SDN83312.1 DNA-binding transcriptional regulator, LysR family [Polaromonas sp. JS666]
MSDKSLDQLKRMAVFAEVVAAGSLTAAARRLGMTPSAVSQHLRQLEQALGLALLHRSTRRLTLTEAGERYHAGCAAMVGAAREAEQALVRLRDEPEGELRLAAPVGFGSLLASALAPLRGYPRLSLRLLLDDKLIDLIAERVDIAVRVGEMADSSLVARKLGSTARQLCASPAYLAERGWPATPQDLLRHDWLGSKPNSSNNADMLELLGPSGECETLRLEGRVQVSQVTALHALAVAGWGISMGVSEDDRKALAEGRLLPVLPGWRMEDMPVYAVTPRRGEQPAKVRYTLELLAAWFGDRQAAGVRSVAGPA